MKIKKDWQKPELVVLLRNKPEEAVLASCKGGTIRTYSNTVNNGCFYDSNSGQATNCVACNVNNNT